MKIQGKLWQFYIKVRNLLYFMIGITVIVLLFPKEGKFQYEFQKGKPWMHELLVAPFNFPIYKTDDVVKAELDSLLKDFQPYFRKDTMVVYNELKSLREKFRGEIWAVYVRELVKAGIDTASHAQKQRLEELGDRYLNGLVNIISDIYNRGIVDDPIVIENLVNPEHLISVINQQVVEDKQAELVFTQKTAYEFFRAEVSKLSEENIINGSDNRLFASVMDPMDFITPNLIYDAETSEKIKSSYESEISLTQGMIQAGEKVIALGEPVNDEKYQILQSLKREYETNPDVQRNLFMITAGQILLAVLAFVVFYFFLKSFRPEILLSGKNTFLLILLISLMSFLASLAIQSENLNVYVIPFVILPIIIKTFFDARIALFVHFLTILLIGFWAPNGFEFVFMNFIAGVVAIFSLTSLYRRGKLFVTAILTFISYSLIYTALGIMQEGRIENLDWLMYAWFSGNALLVLASYPLIYIFERVFRFLSDATLFELSDTNQPLLRELAEKAPGTFQHSLQVANLAEEAAREVGANPLLLRTGALYHDIGKMHDPMYYIENLSSGYNPHDKLKFEESAKIIIGHVIKGAELAKKKKLPEKIIEFILTHHGTTTVQYFYKSYLKQYPDTEVDVAKFTYPGPKPSTKEQAILMMADSVEAASRSLKTVTKEIMEELVENIIRTQRKEKQFDEADLTFREITIIKDLFKRKLINIYHARIEYPE